MFRKVFLITVLLLLGVSAVVRAEIYRYKTDKGQVWYVNQLDDVPAKYRDQIQQKVRSLVPIGKTLSGPGGPSSAPATNQAKSVELYVTTNCPQCTKVEDFLQSNSIAYQKYDVSDKSTGYSSYDAIVRRGTPITKVNGEMIIGFVPGRILGSLSRSGNRSASGRNPSDLQTPPRVTPPPEIPSPEQIPSPPSTGG